MFDARDVGREPIAPSQIGFFAYGDEDGDFINPMMWVSRTLKEAHFQLLEVSKRRIKSLFKHFKVSFPINLFQKNGFRDSVYLW